MEFHKIILFIEKMKDHVSHDIVLLCPTCHQRSNSIDLQLRKVLAEQCNAPLAHCNGTNKMIEKPHLK